MRFSKKLGYERPYIVKGNIKQTGLEEIPKGTIKRIEVMERGKLITLRT